MSSKIFYPYHTDNSSPTLKLECHDHPEIVGTDGNVRLYDTDFQQVSITCKVTVNPNYIKNVLADSEQSNIPVAVIINKHSIQSRIRERIILQGPGPDYSYVMNLDIDKDWTGTLELRVLLVRTTTNPSLPQGYATNQSSILASSEPCRILFDEPPSPPGNRLNIQWANFKTDGAFSSLGIDDQLFELRIESSAPILYLNSNVTGFSSVMMSTATTGRRSAIRNAMNHSIAHQVWTSLLSMAISKLSQIREPDPNDPSKWITKINDLDGWEKPVLTRWSSYLFPEMNDEEAAQELEERSILNEGLPDPNLMVLVTRTIQTRFKTFTSFENLTRYMGTNDG